MVARGRRDHSIARQTGAQEGNGPLNCCQSVDCVDTLAVMAKTESKLQEFAIIGARFRVRELQAEIDRIKKQFGARALGVTGSSALALESGVRPGKLPVAGGGDTGNGRRRRKMSAAARKRISDAQKARWAKQRAKNG
jgi:hypothetical protein